MRQEIGFQLDRVQQGWTPVDGKPFITIGPGVCAIRARDEEGSYRAIYVTKFPQAVYVLHCFRKKTQATRRPDIHLAQQRFGALIQERNNEN